MNSKVSIIIINYNGEKWLNGCLESVFNQSYKNFEVILIDNASIDSSLSHINKQYKKNMFIYENTKNDGYAQGCNIGMKFAKGDYLLLLNTDTVLEKDFIKNFLIAFEKIPDLAIAQSKIVYIDKPTTLDTCGSFWTDTTLLYHYGNSKKATMDLYNHPFPVFSVKAVAAMIKKSVADQIGLFDEKFWCYYEETDFCHRAWLSGYACWYWPNAVAYHGGGGTSLSFPNDFIQFHNFKNKLLSFLKNFSAASLITIIPVYLLVNLLLSIYWLLQGKIKHALSLYKAIGWNIYHLVDTRRKRAIIQRNRVLTDNEYMATCKRNPHLIYYKYLLQLRFDKYQDSSL